MHSRLEEEQITKAAIELVDEKIVDRPSMRSVARKLGVTATSLYRYFQSVEILDVRAGHMAANMLLNSIPYPRGRLARNKRSKVDLAMIELFSHHYLRFALQHPALYRLITPADAHGARFSSGPRGDALLWHHILILISRFTGRRDDGEAAFAFWSLLHGLATIECYHCRLDGKVLGKAPPGVRALLAGLPAAGAHAENASPPRPAVLP